MMSKTADVGRWLPLVLGSSLLFACAAQDAETPPVDEGETCSDADTFHADFCGEVYCGAPEVEVGTGADDFVALADGDDIDVVRGPQGGYHLNVAARMSRLCSVVYLRPSIWLDHGDGSELEEIADGERHVEAVRMEPGGSSLQEYWGVRATIPCEYWPNTTLSCGDQTSAEGHIEDFEVVLKVEVEDHNGRVATDERRLHPTCCAG